MNITTWHCVNCGYSTGFERELFEHMKTCGAPEKANSRQVAGDHYKKNPIQPWDYVAANNLGYFEGTAVKYLTRWKDKGGVDDLRKAIHFIEKLIEIETRD